MQYITIRELAEKWNVSAQTVFSYLESENVPNAVLQNGEWLVPVDAPAPGAQSIRAFMPIWRRYPSGKAAEMIESLANADERALAWAGQHYFQSQYEQACAETEPYLNSSEPELKATALLLHCMANVPLGNTIATRLDMQALFQEAKNPQNAHMAVIYEYILFLVRVFFHDDQKQDVTFLQHFSALPEGMRLYALYAYAHALYLAKDYRRALGVAESALVVAGDCYPSVCVYLYLVASMAAINLSMISLADSFFQQAWELAEPEGYVQPFVEHHGLLQGQVEKYFRDRSPKIYNCISERVLQFSRGWIKIHNPESVNKVTDQLTPFEFALAMMAAKGKSNQEIADYQHISINTVKFHLSNIYQKLGVSRRSELEQFLNR